MVNKAAQELGKKGGQSTSTKKAAAARANAKRPRKPKPMPEYSSYEMLRLAFVELSAERRFDITMHGGMGGLRINGHHIVDVLLSHIENTYPESASWIAAMRAAK